MGGFLSAILGGSNPVLGGAINNAGNVSGYGTTTGMGDTSTASNFLNQLIGGDSSQIARLLAPQIGQMAGAANQQIQTQGEFGNRSGGVNAANQNLIDQTRGNVNNAIAGLTGSAVGQLGQMGQNLLNTGLNANEQQANLSQEQLQNQQQSLGGQFLSGLVGAGGKALGTIGTGWLGTLPGLKNFI